MVFNALTFLKCCEPFVFCDNTLKPVLLRWRCNLCDPLLHSSVWNKHMHVCHITQTTQRKHPHTIMSKMSKETHKNIIQTSLSEISLSDKRRRWYAETEDFLFKSAVYSLLSMTYRCANGYQYRICKTFVLFNSSVNCLIRKVGGNCLI